MPIIEDILNELNKINQASFNMASFIEIDEPVFKRRGVEIYLTPEQKQELKDEAKKDWLNLKDAYTELKNLISQLP